jgi:hypothetical protein
MKPIQVIHDEVPITYNESKDKWEFTLRGHDRSAESLAKAKEYIDKPVPAEKAKPFEKIPAWNYGYSDKPTRIEVTGIAESRGFRPNEIYVWIKNGTKREKVDASYRIYPSNPKNDALMDSIIEKLVSIKKLNNECSLIRQKLEPLVIAKEAE